MSLLSEPSVAAEYIIRQFDESKSEPISHYGFKPEDIEKLNTEEKRYESAVDVLRSLRQLALAEPENDYRRKVLEFAIETMPMKPIRSATVLRAKGKRPAYSTCHEAIANYGSSYSIVKCEDAFILCSNKEDVQDLVDALVPKMTHEIMTIDTPYNYCIITEYNTLQEVRFFTDRLISLSGGKVSHDDIRIHPYEGNQRFVVVSSIQTEYHNQQKLTDQLCKDYPSLKGRIRSVTPTIYPLCDQLIAEIPLIRKIYDRNDRLVTKDVISLRDSPHNIVLNITMGNSVNHMFENKTEQKEEKSKNPIKWSKDWIRKHPAEGMVCSKYYNKYYRDIADVEEIEILSKMEFSRLMESMGYKKKKNSRRSGRYFWYERNEDEDVDEEDEGL
jgi:hypothetical protein